MTQTGQFHPSDNRLGGQEGMSAFFKLRWNGEVPLSQLFWRDMVVVGSIINIGTTIVALLILAAKMSALLAVAVHLSRCLTICSSMAACCGRPTWPGYRCTRGEIGATLWIIHASLL